MSQKVTRMIATPTSLNVESPGRTDQNNQFSVLSSCLICQNGADSHCRPMQKLTDQDYPELLYAITNRKDEISFRLQNKVDPHSDFLEK